MFNIRDIDWGDDSAERDPNLLEYFVQPEHFERLKNYRKTIIIGRKGCGKSAVRKKLSHIMEHEENALTIDILPSESIFQNISNDVEIKNNSLQDILFQYSWINLIMKKILQKIGSLRESKLINGSLSAARKFSISEGTAKSDFIEVISGLLQSIKISFGSVSSVGIQLEKALKKVSSLDSYEYHINNIAADGQKICIFVDDLDIGWDNTELSNKVLFGLLQASLYMKNINPNIHVYIFIRDNIYQILMSKTQHSDKFRDIVNLQWEQDALKSIVQNRIIFNYRKMNCELVEEPFRAVFPDYTGVSLTTNWLFDRTLRRPRELLQFCRLYTENLNSNTPSSDAFKSTEQTYSNWKLNDLCTEYLHQYPEINKIFDFWKAHYFRCKYHLKWEEFNTMVGRIIEEIDINHTWFEEIKKVNDSKRLAHVIYEIGFIGDFILGGDGGSKTCYSYDGHTPSFSEIQIHPCFRKAVGTVERIRSS